MKQLCRSNRGSKLKQLVSTQTLEFATGVSKPCKAFARRHGCLTTTPTASINDHCDAKPKAVTIMIGAKGAAAVT